MNKINTYIKPILYLGWVLFFITLWIKCGNSEKPNTHKITIDEVKGKFEPKDSINHKPITSLNKENVSLIGKGKDGKTLKNKDFTKLKNDISILYNEMEMQQKEFAKESDSLKRIILYNKATQLNEFHEEFEDDKLYLLASGLVAGSEVKQLGFNYKIKEQSITTPETKLRFLAGVTIGNSLDFNNPLFSAGIGLQNKKGNILLGSFDTEKRISIGYYQRIKVKKP